ncbi:hypothetical protein DU508_05260 [Pedobacter chinensis]|uniref:Uncharacterized protein n=1 Tax=Pedobacter chinensis TaxID=2282421 RepID=A0A369Q1G2_9SPHI|nr:hypothetical protein [Pedobacter chinensis]RDC58342.1 hypothetical protein DU508_05260 [Pedobacter chinensis]
MKKKLAVPFLFIVILLSVSCEKEGQVNKCYQVKYISDYCPKPGAALVSFTSPNKDATAIADSKGGIIDYRAALLNVPDKFKEENKIFYVKYNNNHKDMEFKDCAGVDQVAILTADGTSDVDCNHN